MFKTNQDSTKTLSKVRTFGNLRTLIISALFVALSIVLGKQLSITVGAFRISFENLPILMAGVFFNPIVAMIVGLCADVIGCLIVGYAINPVITIGAMSIGLISGLVSQYCVKNEYSLKLRLILSVGLSHIIGSMIIKSIGLYVYYHYAVGLLLFRIPLYIVIGTLEIYILYALLKNKSFNEQLQRLKV